MSSKWKGISVICSAIPIMDRVMRRMFMVCMGSLNSETSDQNLVDESCMAMRPISGSVTCRSKFLRIAAATSLETESSARAPILPFSAGSFVRKLPFCIR